MADFKSPFEEACEARDECLMLLTHVLQNMSDIILAAQDGKISYEKMGEKHIYIRNNLDRAIIFLREATAITEKSS